MGAVLGAIAARSMPRNEPETQPQTGWHPRNPAPSSQALAVTSSAASGLPPSAAIPRRQQPAVPEGEPTCRCSRQGHLLSNTFAVGDKTGSLATEQATGGAPRMATLLPWLSCTRPEVTGVLPVACCPQLPGPCCGSSHQYQRVDRSRKEASPAPEKPPFCMQLFRPMASSRHTHASVCYPEALLPVVSLQDRGGKP